MLNTSFVRRMSTSLFIGRDGLDHLTRAWHAASFAVRCTIALRVLLVTCPYLVIRLSAVVIPRLLMAAMRRLFRAPVMRYFFPLALLSFGAVYINIVADDARFLSFSYGIATACLTLGVAWSFIRFFLPGDETIITKDPKSYALVIVAVLLSVAFVLGTR